MLVKQTQVFSEDAKLAPIAIGVLVRSPEIDGFFRGVPPMVEKALEDGLREKEGDGLFLVGEQTCPSSSGKHFEEGRFSVGSNAPAVAEAVAISVYVVEGQLGAVAEPGSDFLRQRQAGLTQSMTDFGDEENGVAGRNDPLPRFHRRNPSFWTPLRYA